MSLAGMNLIFLSGARPTGVCGAKMTKHLHEHLANGAGGCDFWLLDCSSSYFCHSEDGYPRS